MYYDDGGAIGKRYRRQDEVGTPWCVTIDFDTIEKPGDTFTLRERDSMKQNTHHRGRALRAAGRTRLLIACQPAAEHTEALTNFPRSQRKERSVRSLFPLLPPVRKMLGVLSA